MPLVVIPEEVLTDKGTLFMSKCMQEVSRLLSIRDLTSTPYHPVCNGLVERWKGALKTLYREVLKESTGLSPVELCQLEGMEQS